MTLLFITLTTLLFSINCIYTLTESSSNNGADTETISFRARTYAQNVVLRFWPQSDEQVDILANRLNSITNETLDFWTEPSYSKRPVDLMVPSHLLDSVRNFAATHGFNGTQVVVQDVQGLIQATSQPEPRHGELRSDLQSLDTFFRTFHRLSGIHSYMDQLAARYPDLATVDSIGSSFEGRPMKIIKISASGTRRKGRRRARYQNSDLKNNTLNNKEIIWVDAGIHAREWLAPPTALFLAFALTTRYGKDQLVTSVLDSFDFVILPSANPDGYEYSHTNDRMWRKTRSTGHSTRCTGVDPNRNFDFHWREIGASSNPCTETFAGPRAFSEPETQAIASYLSRNKDLLRVYISLHSYSQLWLYPWGHTRSKSNRNAQLESKAKAAVSAINRVYGTSYKYGPSASVLYPAAGGSDDWAHGSLGIPYSYTVELRPGSYASNGFLVPPSEIRPTGIETSTGILALARNLIDNGDKITG